MALKDIIQSLTEKNESPSITLSFNTYRTFPDSEKNPIILKNLIKEAESRLLEEYGKRDIPEILEKLEALPEKVTSQKLMDSLHVFISKEVDEMVVSPWPVDNEAVFIDDSFAVKPLIKALNRTKEYMILSIAQGGAHLFEALNDRSEERRVGKE